jgi:hypothetical protein
MSFRNKIQRSDHNWSKTPDLVEPDEYLREESLEERKQKKGYD